MEKIKETEAFQVHDGCFHKLFDSVENARDFLKMVLPEDLRSQLDLEDISVEDTKYVSNEFKRRYSDIVLKTWLSSQLEEKVRVEIYFVVEHKGESEVEVFIQVLNYMVLEWEKDYNEKKKPRLIIPVVFYQGEKKWKVPLFFADQFDVPKDIKKYLLNFGYILFDLSKWSLNDERNQEIKKNINLFTTIALMKAVNEKDLETIKGIVNFWVEHDFLENKELMFFYLTYIVKTKEIKTEQLKKILEESHIDGGEIMPTLAQQMKEEFLETYGPQLIDKGKQEGIETTAKNMIRKGIDMNIIVDITGLPVEKIKQMALHIQRESH